MPQFQSTEELASSIATGIGNAASSIKSVGKVTMDASSAVSYTHLRQLQAPAESAAE